MTEEVSVGKTRRPSRGQLMLPVGVVLLCCTAARAVPPLIVVKFKDNAKVVRKADGTIPANFVGYFAPKARLTLDDDALGLLRAPELRVPLG